MVEIMEMAKLVRPFEICDPLRIISDKKVLYFLWDHYSIPCLEQFNVRSEFEASKQFLDIKIWRWLY